MIELHHATVFDAFRASARRYAGHPFLHTLAETAQIYGVPPGTLTYADALAEVERLAAIYRRAGYGHGHRAGLLLENRPSFFLHWLAFNALGVSAVPINADLRSAEIEYLTAHSDISLAVTLGAARQATCRPLRARWGASWSSQPPIPSSMWDPLGLLLRGPMLRDWTPSAASSTRPARPDARKAAS